MTLRLGTRRSLLATTQSGWVADRLRDLGHEVELVTVTTEGDTNRASLSQIGGTGVFASALRDALRGGAVDLAVHSLKDLPTTPAPGLVVAAVPEREDPRDVLVTAAGPDGPRLVDLPDGTRIGTGSPRRASQLEAYAATLGRSWTLVDIRGNVDSRIALATSRSLDAVVLARAGLLRLGRTDHVADVIEPEVLLPAAGQGALAVECRADDLDLRAALAALEHPATRVCTETERALLAVLEAGCTAPVGALARVTGEDVTLAAYGNGRRTSVTGPATDPHALAAEAATMLLEHGRDPR